MFLHLSPEEAFVMKVFLVAAATAVTAVAHQVFLRRQPLSRKEWRAYQAKHRYYKYRRTSLYPTIILVRDEDKR